MARIEIHEGMFRCRDCRQLRVVEIKGEDLKRLGQPLRKLLEWGRMPEARLENIMSASAEVGFCGKCDEIMTPELMDEYVERWCFEAC